MVKRHKRTLQRMQDMARLQGMTPAMPDMVTPVPQVGDLPATSSQWAEVKGPSTTLHVVPPVGSSSLGGREQKDLYHEATGNSSQQNTVPPTTSFDNTVEAQIEVEQHAAGVQAHQPWHEMKVGNEVSPSIATGWSNSQSMEARMDVNGCRNGPKRKMMGPGRGGKKLRASQAPQPRPERVREQPLVCTICNVTCDTRAVFDIHLGGKKHQSRIKRSQCADTVFGPLVVDIPSNQPVARPMGAPEPLYYGLKSRDMVEQEAYLLGAVKMQQAFPIVPQAGQAMMAAERAQATSGATYHVQPMSAAVDDADKPGPGAVYVGMIAAERAQATSEATYHVQPMSAAVDYADKLGPGAVYVGMVAATDAVAEGALLTASSVNAA